MTDQLEAGVREVFTSDRYQAYLKTMSKFHRYSFGNVLLIAMQCPSASCVAGFHAWKKNFGRTVKKGEKGHPHFSALSIHPHGRNRKDRPV